MTLFDAFITVDWSANSEPKLGADSIWVGVRVRGEGSFPTINLPTRAEATAHLRSTLLSFVEARLRTLVGLDFPYGYPAGFGATLGAQSVPPTPAWEETWNSLSREIQDGTSNRNNRFTVASALNQKLGQRIFWGCPDGQANEHLSTKGPNWGTLPLRKYRHTELALRGQGRQPQETWKLWTTGSVGSQALVGIPRVAALRFDPELRAHSRVWPFETGFTQEIASEAPSILHAEIWPGVVPLPPLEGRVKDAVQVEALAQHLELLDDTGRLGSLFDRPRGLTDQAVQECVSEEGWILGA